LNDAGWVCDLCGSDRHVARIFAARDYEYGVPGAWRVEVSGGAAFLHVLVPGDRGATVPAARLLEDAAAVGVEVAGKRVVFRTDRAAATVTDARPR